MGFLICVCVGVLIGVLVVLELSLSHDRRIAEIRRRSDMECND